MEANAAVTLQAVQRLGQPAGNGNGTGNRNEHAEGYGDDLGGKQRKWNLCSRSKVPCLWQTMLADLRSSVGFLGCVRVPRRPMKAGSASGIKVA
ncbi:hypothetical protein AHAS_Ahas19G0180500 [Arachis hypogaea]